MDLTWIKEWGDDALRIIFPKVCEVCGASLIRGEDIMCLHCTMDMPRTGLHLDKFNIIHQRLVGKAPIDKASGYFYYYRDSDYAKLIHKAKYNGRTKIIEYLASKFAKELLKDNFFNGIDAIQPVPMHWFKKLHRGYNQSEIFAKRLSRETGIPLCNNLVSKRWHKSQTRKNRYERWLNTKEVYCVIANSELGNKHILVVDDVITTGATILSCCEAIHKASPNTRLSVLSLGVTQLQ